MNGVVISGVGWLPRIEGISIGIGPLSGGEPIFGEVRKFIQIHRLQN